MKRCVLKEPQQSEIHAQALGKTDPKIKARHRIKN